MEVMITSAIWGIFFTIITTLFSTLPSLTISQLPHDYPPTANLSTKWINEGVIFNASMEATDISAVRVILYRETTSGGAYATGFCCSGTCEAYLFAIFIVPSDNIESWKIVWSANRNRAVGINATLELTDEGELILKDADGTLAWSTNTAGRSIVGLNLTEIGNLVLFNAKGSVVWQSFDHPTDCLVPGQILLSGMNLTASVSATNWSAEGSLYSLSMKEQGLEASIVVSDSMTVIPQPQVYFKKDYFFGIRNKEASYAKYQNGSLELYINNMKTKIPDMTVPIPTAISAQYMKLDSDGNLRVFQWDDDGYWGDVADIFTRNISECGFPMSCGTYGVCSCGRNRQCSKGRCSCPRGGNFKENLDHDFGCSEVIPLTCNASKNHTFLDLVNVTYFAFTPEVVQTDLSSCKVSCLGICSCKAVVFRYSGDPSLGDCYMPNQLFTLMEYEYDKDSNYNYSVSIKVQSALNTTFAVEETPAGARGKTAWVWLEPLLGSSLGVICIGVVIGGMICMRRMRRRKAEEVEEMCLDHVPGMPNRFSFQELETATNNFSNKLGEGGFGSVFQGSLHDRTRVAVKRLHGVGHVKKSFLAEVQTIGSIHHINLVRLMGFCAEKSHRLLVYEYVCNGSLDRWIYCKNHESKLSWSYRRKIILDIAKGIAYLHEGCRQKIIHLDIKPQNILLDDHYNAKLADFGLSKLIDRDQSQVVTSMRGTPGYLAPEWLTAAITEKVDVYSFGVVVLEIVCGRPIFEQSRAEEERHLLAIFKRKAELGEWMDLADEYCCRDVESNVDKIEQMMRISGWCLQSDYQRRPSMSTVVKVLEGVVNVEGEIDYNFWIPQYLIRRISQGESSHNVTHVVPSALSGPR